MYFVLAEALDATVVTCDAPLATAPGHARESRSSTERRPRARGLGLPDVQPALLPIVEWRGVILREADHFLA